MSQVGTSNYPIPNDTGANFRADVNENLTDLYSTSSGSSAPPAAIEGQLWINTSNTPDTLECKTSSGWVVLGKIAQNFGLSTSDTPTFTGGLNLPAGSTSSLSLRRSDDPDTGFYFSATNTLMVHAGGANSHEFTSTYSTPKVPLRAVDGTDAAPGVTNAGDEDTGLVWSAANELSVTTGGTRRTSIDSSGLWIKSQKELRLQDADNTHYVGIKSPGTVASNVVLTLPDTDGNNNEVLKSNGSGVLTWATVASLQEEQNVVVKGAIAFTGSNGTATVSNKLTVTRTGTGIYVVTLDASIRTNNTNYGVVIGNVNEGRTTSSEGESTHLTTDNWQDAWVASRSNNDFTVRAIEYHPWNTGYSGRNDEDTSYVYRRDVCDPDYISLVVF